MDFSGFGNIILKLVILTIAVLTIKPVITYVIVKKFGYSNRTSFFTSVQIAQVGEFSLVLAATGMMLDPVNLTQPIFSMIIILTIFTMILTAYIIKYDDTMYDRFFSKLLRRFSSDRKKEYEEIKKQLSNHVIIFGLHKMSEKIITGLKEKKKQFVLVDHNPEKIKELLNKNINCICSDMTNPEVYEAINVKSASIIVSTIQNVMANTLMIRKTKSLNKTAIIMIAANNEAEAARLYESGADFVIIPLILGGAKVVDYLTHLKPEEISMWGKKYYEEIKTNKGLFKNI